MKLLRFAPFFALLVIASAGLAGEPARERVPFNDGWRFKKNDPSGVGDSLKYSKSVAVKKALIASACGDRLTEELKDLGKSVPYAGASFDDSRWRKLDLPHDWGIEGPFDQKLPGETGKLPWAGIAWYRKTFTLPASDAGRRVYLDIDGAMSYSLVWCNGRFVGGWPYGYSSFRLDLTPYIRPGQKNTLAIRLENPPSSSRWYPGAGIYRNVWLVKTGPVHVAHWGTAVTTPEVTPASATVQIKTDVTNSLGKETRVDLKSEIFELDAKLQKGSNPVATAEVLGTVLPLGKTIGVLARATVENPRLWSPRSPFLYAAVVTILRDGEVADVYETRFGIRSIEFKPESGFWLNGERVQINGVCNHHDLGALGTAWNERAAERQLEILKEMGCNALRTSHNPPAPELLDLCDRMGILVMDEAFDCWKIGKRGRDYNKLWDDWHERDLRALIRRDSNHPSVILWSLGNEVIEPRGPAIATHLTSIARDADPTRPTTVGSNVGVASNNGVQKSVGVMGLNYQGKSYEQFRKDNPTVPLIATETASALSSRGEYFFQTREQVDAKNAADAKAAAEKRKPVPPPKSFAPVSEDRRDGFVDHQVSSYDFSAWTNRPHEEFIMLEKNPHVAGEFVWTGFDYLGEPTPFHGGASPSRSSYFGIVDLAGFKKDRFFLYQAHWRPELPMAHILPHWNWPDRLGQVTPVHVYTSGDEAELFLNGQSQGRIKKQPFEYRLRWYNVVYQPGELKVVAYKDGKDWATDVMKTAGPAAKLSLEADRPAILNDGSDLAFVTVKIQDKDGTLVPRSNNLIKFEVSGPGEIVAVDNGDATSHDAFQAPERKAYNGMALAIIRARKGSLGDLILKATSEPLQAASTTIRVKPSKEE